MISRYTKPEMARIWTDESRFEKMLAVELAAAEAMAKRGQFSISEVEQIRKKARINVQEINEIEKVVKHDVIAFLTQIERSVGKSARFLHLGMTSSDVLDTALALQMVESTKLLRSAWQELLKITAPLARKHKNTLMAGRTHGVHAEPTTFGIKVAGWYSELCRGLDRLDAAENIIAFGKISGAVGTYAHVDPSIEKVVCKKLGLRVEPVSTQIIPRDRHAQFLNILALLGASLERIALEIRHLQRTEVLEAEEPFSEGQRGSSAMPHKRNPIACENICGLARLLRGNAMAALENVALWHERDISHSSVERVILPDSTIALHFMIGRLQNVLKDLNVYPERMRQNLQHTEMILVSQRLMLNLIEKGGAKFSREAAYKTIQVLAQKAWKEKVNFQELVEMDAAINQVLPKALIRDCFDVRYFVRHADRILKSAGL